MGFPLFSNERWNRDNLYRDSVHITGSVAQLFLSSSVFSCNISISASSENFSSSRQIIAHLKAAYAVQCVAPGE